MDFNLQGASGNSWWTKIYHKFSKNYISFLQSKDDSQSEHTDSEFLDLLESPENVNNSPVHRCKVSKCFGYSPFDSLKKVQSKVVVPKKPEKPQPHLKHKTSSRRFNRKLDHEKEVLPVRNFETDLLQSSTNSEDLSLCSSQTSDPQSKTAKNIKNIKRVQH